MNLSRRYCMILRWSYWMILRWGYSMICRWIMHYCCWIISMCLSSYRSTSCRLSDCMICCLRHCCRLIMSSCYMHTCRVHSRMRCILRHMRGILIMNDRRGMTQIWGSDCWICMPLNSRFMDDLNLVISVRCTCIDHRYMSRCYILRRSMPTSSSLNELSNILIWCLGNRGRCSSGILIQIGGFGWDCILMLLRTNQTLSTMTLPRRCWVLTWRSTRWTTTWNY